MDIGTNMKEIKKDDNNKYKHAKTFISYVNCTIIYLQIHLMLKPKVSKLCINEKECFLNENSAKNMLCTKN